MPDNKDMIAEKFKNHQFTLTLNVGNLIEWLEHFKGEVTEKSVQLLIDSGILEKTHAALKQQIFDEIDFMINEHIEDHDKIGHESISECDDKDCNSLMNSEKNEDFFFEVPEEFAGGKSPMIAVCQQCWETKGYAEIYYSYRKLVDNGGILR